MPGKPSRTPASPNGHGRRAPRVGLVLGGGGILGGAWLVGAVHALAEHTSWEPHSADYLVGTSAGSVIASFLSVGIPSELMVYHQRGGDVSGLVDAAGEPLADADEGARRLFTFQGRVPRPVLGSPKLLARTITRPWRFPPTTALSGWLGRGFLRNDEVGRMIRAVAPEGWTPHPGVWIVAVDYETGRRVVFGTPDAPVTDLWRAVQASCAIPGLYQPTEIDGRSYIDGGAWSPSNADLLARTDVDIVIAMNPMSSLYPGLPTSFLERFDRRIRRATGRRLGREARRLRGSGKRVLLIQPRKPDLDVMGVNLMDPSRRLDVLETALRTVGARLKEPDARAVLAELG